MRITFKMASSINGERFRQAVGIAATAQRITEVVAFYRDPQTGRIEMIQSAGAAERMKDDVCKHLGLARSSEPAFALGDADTSWPVEG